MKKKLVALALVSMLAVAFTPDLVRSQAGFESFTVGAQVTLRDHADATAGPDLNGFVRLTRNLTLEGGYAASGEGAMEALARLGAHYTVYSFGYELDSIFDVTLGGGVAVRALGVELTESGGFISLGLQGDLPTIGEWRFAVDVNGNFERQPKPNMTIRSAKVFRF